MNEQVVEILAPAGSPDALWAAVQHGADAVYLGLKSFNARGNAINFTVEELADFVPRAHQQGTKIYLTLNTLVKMDEREPLLRELDGAARAGIDGVILQDIGLGRMIARHFPHLRRHASTQMAIHNLEGVQFCVDEGFERVVLARELTLAEIAEIRGAFPPDVIELEVFCHGAMCYTYSGMCFFSGSVGGRSGNRGECAYTCRKGYRIHNQTPFPMAAPKGSFHNYLFSMKDMNTLDLLPELLKAGVDSLKIEGRRKGPAYVSASVAAYRDRLAGRPSQHHEDDLQLAFGRDYTKAFYQRGQYGDAPIDITATGTQGRKIGTVASDGWFTLEHAGIQRYDGIRLVLPDRSEQSLSFRDFRVDGGDRHLPQRGARIQLAQNFPEGTEVMWVHSQEVERRYLPGKQASGQGVTGWDQVDMNAVVEDDILRVTAVRGGIRVGREFGLQPATSGKPIRLRKLMFRFGDTPFREGCWVGPEEVAGFVPLSQLKQARREMLAELAEHHTEQHRHQLDNLVSEALGKPVQPQAFSGEPTLIVRVDRPQLLEAAAAWAQTHGHHLDFVMRPTLSTPDWNQSLALLQQFKGSARLVLPLVLRGWDLRLIRRRLKALRDQPFEFVLSNPSHMPLLDGLGLNSKRHLDFSVYHLNDWSYRALLEKGVTGRFTLSLEDDRPNMEALLAHTDPSRFEVIAYTDTPLFIAEACSLAALYGGCPGTKKCGHETLQIENEHGDFFQVRHDRCRSVVIGEKALSWSGSLSWFTQRGVGFFRADFTTRDYTPQQMEGVLAQLLNDQPVPQTHTENLDRVLL